jgi:alanyl-tRNA synthetase
VVYGASPDSDTALRVIADHARAAAFLVSDGVMPGNEGRAYVLRRIMRRALRFGWKVGISEPFFHKVTSEVVDRFQDAYPDLGKRADFIQEVVLAEEQRFQRTLDRGMALLDQELDTAKGGTKSVHGDAAFKLWDTYGFPLDLTEQIAEEHGIAVDQEGFVAAMAVQKEKGRANWKGAGAATVDTLWADLAAEFGPTDFTGYTNLSRPGTVVALVRTDGDLLQRVDRLDAGQAGVVLLDSTPFYGESGGQAGDTGLLSAHRVTDTRKANGLHLHHIVAAEALSIGDVLEAKVDVPARAGTARNHTGTHLLHAALRSVLGEHVTQKGSLVAPDRLRFDFSHHKPVTLEELKQVEDLVNAEVLANKALETTVDNLEAAIAKGAMALFGEKYDNDVRVVSVPGFSTELCGGTHVSRTGDIGPFTILSEAGIASGVRRIEAQTGTGALAVFRGQQETLSDAAKLLKAPADRLVEAVSKLQEDRKALEKEVAALKREMAQAAAGDLMAGAKEIGGVKVLVARFDGDLKEQADRLRSQLGTSVVVLASGGAKAQMIVAVSKDIAGSRVHAGNVVKALAPMIGGGGGGSPDMAQAGGKDPSGIDDMLARAAALAEELLG